MKYKMKYKCPEGEVKTKTKLLFQKLKPEKTNKGKKSSNHVDFHPFLSLVLFHSFNLCQPNLTEIEKTARKDQQR